MPLSSNDRYLKGYETGFTTAARETFLQFAAGYMKALGKPTLTFDFHDFQFRQSDIIDLQRIFFKQIVLATYNGVESGTFVLRDFNRCHWFTNTTASSAHLERCLVPA